MKNSARYVYLFSLISSVLILSSCDKSTDTVAEPISKSIAKAGKIYSNNTLELNNSHNKIFSELVGEVKAGQKVLLLESSGWNNYKIQLANGTMGWINKECLRADKNSFIRYQSSGNNRHIASNRGAIGADRKIVQEVNEKTAITRLEEYKEVKSATNILFWTKVRTEEGNEGWIMSDYIYRVVMDPYRFIHRKDWHFGFDPFKGAWKGENIKEFTSKFKEAAAIKLSDGQEIHYFNNIFLTENSKLYYGTRVYVKDQLIVDIDAGKSKTYWAGYLPLSSSLQSNLIGNYVGNWYYLFENVDSPDRTVIDIRDHMPNWLAWIVFILVFLIGLAILFYILKIPFIIVNKIVYKQSLNRKLYNSRIKLYAISGSLILGYLYSVIILVNIYPFNDYFFVTALFCLGMIIGNISKWRNDLDYNRCNAPSCHQWTGEWNGTEYLGGSTTTQTITYSSGSKETNSQTTRHYREYRKCSACGYEWSFVRTEVIGGLKY